jgi:hypothetical protein
MELWCFCAPEDERIKKEETEGLAKLNESYEKQR